MPFRSSASDHGSWGHGGFGLGALKGWMIRRLTWLNCIRFGSDMRLRDDTFRYENEYHQRTIDWSNYNVRSNIRRCLTYDHWSYKFPLAIRRFKWSSHVVGVSVRHVLWTIFLYDRLSRSYRNGWGWVDIGRKMNRLDSTNWSEKKNQNIISRIIKMTLWHSVRDVRIRPLRYKQDHNHRNQLYFFINTIYYKYWSYLWPPSHCLYDRSSVYNHPMIGHFCFIIGYFQINIARLGVIIGHFQLHRLFSISGHFLLQVIGESGSEIQAPESVSTWTKRGSPIVDHR